MDVPDLELSAATEQIYFGSALASLTLAKRTADQISDFQATVTWLDVYRQLQMWDLGDEIDFVEDDVRAQEESVKRVSELFSLFIQSIVTTDVFAVMTLEAHVNSVASQHLSRSVWDVFDRLSIDGKWLFLPNLVMKPRFDSGSEPFQSLKRLVKKRNDLVHAKGVSRHSLLRSGANAKDFIQAQLRNAEHSVAIVRDLVVHLAAKLGVACPSWARDSVFDYYEIRPYSAMTVTAEEESPSSRDTATAGTDDNTLRRSQTSSARLETAGS